MSARRPITSEQLLALTTAVNAAARALPRREERARHRLQYAAQQLLAGLGAGHLLIDRPPPYVAFEQVAAALKIANEAGVARRDLVVLFNGDDER